MYPKPEFLNKPDVDGSSDYMPSSTEDSSKDSSVVPQQIEQLEFFNEDNHKSSQVRNTSNSTHSEEYTNNITITCSNLARELRIVKSKLREAISKKNESNNDDNIKRYQQMAFNSNKENRILRGILKEKKIPTPIVDTPRLLVIDANTSKNTANISTESGNSNKRKHESLTSNNVARRQPISRLSFDDNNYDTQRRNYHQSGRIYNKNNNRYYTPQPDNSIVIDDDRKLAALPSSPVEKRL